ncbi:MAG TPA: HAD family hydrolase [Mycobacteriales bacterium]|nr:HAD family hydrolase [Mycobacteriales bacterium]
MTVTAVLFDWGGTLTPWHTIELGDGWKACGLGDEAAERLVAAEDGIWARARATQRSGTIDEVFAMAGVTAGPAELAAYYAWWEEHTYTDPEVEPLLRALRERGIRIGVLSNTLWPRTEHQRVFRRDGVAELIDAAVYTSEIEWTKPHPEAFRTALAAVGAEPEDAVFVGDRPWDDIAGAKGVGMRAVLIPHSTIPAYQQGPVQGEPDAIVSRLSELLPLVDGWR